MSYSDNLSYFLSKSGLDFFIRNVFYCSKSNKIILYLLKSLIYGIYSQYSLEAILILFSLTIKVLITQMLVAFNPISSKSLDSYQFQLQNTLYLVGLVFAQQYSKYIRQPFNSQSMDFQTRNTNSLTTTKGLLSPYDNNHSLFPTSIDSSSFQQQQRMNTS